jgi:pilus assembly protein Flp/PilA
MHDLFSDETGATMVEYGLMVALVALVALVSVSVLGKNVSKEFSVVASTV